MAGILSATFVAPAEQRSIQAIFQNEGVPFAADVGARLGIKSVCISQGETGSDLAIAAALEAIEQAGIKASEIDLIIDYSVLPQEYLVPAWNMSNKLQHVTGATKAFTLGFSGNGATTFLVALKAAAGMLTNSDGVETALLVGADLAIPGNRILNQDHPITVLGDGASAMVLRMGQERLRILDTVLGSEGSWHDNYYIPGGALAYPDQPDLYRLQIDLEGYRQAPRMETLSRQVTELLGRNGLKRSDIAAALYTNVSKSDAAEFATVTGLDEARLLVDGRESHGHVQANDFVLNYILADEKGRLQPGEYLLICSHGMGFTAGTSLIQC